MTLDPLTIEGEATAALARAAVDETIDRTALYDALLNQPLCVIEPGPGAPPGPSLKIGSDGPTVRLSESLRLGAPVVTLYPSSTAMIEAARERDLWPDGVTRAVVLEKGAVFPSLRGHPGALIAAGEGQAAALDAGEVASLAERLTPRELVEALRKLIAIGRPREAARRLAGRPLYTLGHPRGGMLMFQRDLPAFLHLAGAERFAERIAQQTGGRVQQGLVAAAELFKNAARGKLFVLIDPGPAAIRFRPEDLR